MKEFMIAPMSEKHLDALVEVDKLCFTRPWTRAGLQAE